MKGKRIQLYNLTARYLGMDAYDLIRAVQITGSRIEAMDVRYLCRLGIPASGMMTRKDLEEWILEKGVEYMKQVKGSNLYKAKRILDRMLLLTRKQLK